MAKNRIDALVRDDASGTPQLTPQERGQVWQGFKEGLQQVAGEIGAELGRQFDHGSTELVQALVTGGSAFVPYGWAATEDVQAPATPQAQQEAQKDFGMEM